MFILIVGCGRVGSSVARAMLREGHEVSCLDEDPESHARLEVGLEKSWEDLGGQFTVGAGLETEALVAAGIEKADAFIASTDGDNTNIVIAQIAQRRYEVPTVIARVLDPLRAEWYQRQGLHTVCPTRVAIDMLESAVRERRSRRSPRRRRRSRVGERARTHVHHRRRSRQGRLEPRPRAAREGARGDPDRERPAPLPDGRAGARAQRPLRRRLRALGAGAGRDPARRHGDRGDRRRRGQHADLPGRAREVPGRPDHRPRQQPAQPPALRSARHQAVGLGDRPDPAAARARGARVRPGPPARPAGGAAGDHRDAARQGLRRHRPPGRRPADARGQPADLGAAGRQGVRADRRHRARGRATRSWRSSTPAKRRN